MRTTNKGVIVNWHNGKPAQSHNGNLWTDGKDLYSYRMLIGITVAGEKHVLDVRGQYRYSATTSQHVGRAIRECGVEKQAHIVEPIMQKMWRFFPDELLNSPGREV